MLRQLRIHNLILVEYAEIHFQEGFNAITGETGSGKSAILAALGLLLGERGDTSLIRKGAEKGIVEAEFDLSPSAPLTAIFGESGIDLEPDSPLLIRREISTSGKGRAFVNQQMVQVSFLKKMGEHIAEIVGQHANRRLIHTDHHREILDAYGSLEGIRKQFTAGWEKEKATRENLEQLRNNEAVRLREIEVCQREITEIDEANMKEGEEEELFAEYTRLVNSEELARCTSGAIESLDCLSDLNQTRAHVETLVSLDPALEECAKIVKSSILELREVIHTLERYLHRIDHNPHKVETINQRLKVLNHLKKKYGSTLQEILDYRNLREEKLFQLESSDMQIEELQEKLEVLSKQNRAVAETLTEKRSVAAAQLEEALIDQLQSLNMSKAKIKIALTSQPTNRWGNDHVELFLIPNVGEGEVSITHCASGGELSRLILAVHTLLAGKEGVPTLIFDEVDANIGGNTATKVGVKLREIARSHQLLCITHFPQVASQADHHLQISKSETDGRTVTLVKVVERKERKKELARMLGG